MLAWALLASAVLSLAPIGWFDQLLRQVGRPDLVQLNASDPSAWPTVANPPTR